MDARESRTHPKPGNRKERNASAANWTFHHQQPSSLLFSLSPSALLLCRSPHSLPSNLILSVSVSSSDPRIASYRSALYNSGEGVFEFRGDLGDAGDGLKGLCTAKLEQHARPRRGGRGRRDSVNSRSPRDRGECSDCPVVLWLPPPPACIPQRPTASQHMVFTFP